MRNHWRLTPRETEVMNLLARGHSATIVGSILDISPRTVEGHVLSVRRKIGVHSTLRAVMIWIDR